MKVRYKARPEVTGSASSFNTSGLGEVIVGFHAGDMTSESISELEIRLADGQWKDMAEAFRAHDLITDNHHSCFFEPRSVEERERGWAG